MVGKYCEGRRAVEWNRQKTIIIDVVGRRERHICTRKAAKDTPSLRHFGPQDEDDLLDQAQLVSLEKVLLEPSQLFGVTSLNNVQEEDETGATATR